MSSLTNVNIHYFKCCCLRHFKYCFYVWIYFQMVRGKTLGSVDVGLSVISTKSQRRRIDIDAEEHIYHLKV